METLLNKYIQFFGVGINLGDGYDKITVTKSDDVFIFEPNTFTVNDIDYTIEYSDPNITITKSGESDPIFTINTSQENPTIIENTISEIKTKVEENKENEIKKSVTNSFNTQYPILFNENSLTGSTTSEIVNNGLLSINVALNLLRNNNMMQTLLSSVSSDYTGLELTCEGTAQWDWKDCATTFTITSLKYNISGTDTELINEGQSITIKKDYSDDANAKNDITENDVLVELLKNNKLFYKKDSDSTKYVFNKVDFSGMKYYVFLSKHINVYYDYMYCLKCALNEHTDDNTFGHFSYYYNCYDYSNYSYQCKHYTNQHQYDTNENYDTQRRILDTTAADNNYNREQNSYADANSRKLCTKAKLTEGWVSTQ